MSRGMMIDRDEKGHTLSFVYPSLAEYMLLLTLGGWYSFCIRHHPKENKNISLRKTFKIDILNLVVDQFCETETMKHPLEGEMVAKESDDGIVSAGEKEGGENKGCNSYGPTTKISKKNPSLTLPQQQFGGNAAKHEEDPKQKAALLASVQDDFLIPASPDVIPLAAGQRLVAIGDIHGRFGLLVNSLVASKIIQVDNNNDDDDDAKDSNYNWIGGNTICVQVGDVLDRGCKEEKCIRLLAKLARQAKEAGGAVVLLWGNHEVLNAIGRFDCTTDKKAFQETFGKVLGDNPTPTTTTTNYKALGRVAYYGEDCHVRFAALAPGGPLAEPFLSKLKVAVKVGRTVLVHAGLTVDHLDTYGGIAVMNEAARKWILSPQDDDPKGWADYGGPLWMRNYSAPSSQEPKNEKVRVMVDSLLQELDVDRIVIGHTIQDSVNSVLDGKVWRIDIGDGVSYAEEDMRKRMIAFEVIRHEDGTENARAVRRHGKWLPPFDGNS